jgi:hypothetical protein
MTIFSNALTSDVYHTTQTLEVSNCGLQSKASIFRCCSFSAARTRSSSLRVSNPRPECTYPQLNRFGQEVSNSTIIYFPTIINPFVNFWFHKKPMLFTCYKPSYFCYRYGSFFPLHFHHVGHNDAQSKLRTASGLPGQLRIIESSYRSNKNDKHSISSVESGTISFEKF